MEDVTARVLSENFDRNTGFEKWDRTRFYTEKAGAIFRKNQAHRMHVVTLEGREVVEHTSYCTYGEASEIIEYYGKNYRLSIGEKIFRGKSILVIRLVKASKLPAAEKKSENIVPEATVFSNSDRTDKAA